jgi:hypothetical protein
MTTNTPVKQIASALVKAQKQFAPALKSATNPHFKSKYADLAACVEAVIDALNSNGIFLMQQTHESEGGVVIETTFVHESGEVMSAGRFYSPASKQDPQGYGSATTYARRYSLMAACGIAPEDDDGNAASAKRPTIVRTDKYPSEDFQKNLKAWVGLIESGNKTAEDLITMIESKGSLSSDQKAILHSVKQAEAA